MQFGQAGAAQIARALATSLVILLAYHPLFPSTPSFLPLASLVHLLHPLSSLLENSNYTIKYGEEQITDFNISSLASSSLDLYLFIVQSPQDCIMRLIGCEHLYGHGYRMLQLRS